MCLFYFLTLRRAPKQEEFDRGLDALAVVLPQTVFDIPI